MGILRLLRLGATLGFAVGLSSCGGTVSFKDRGINGTGNGLIEGTSEFNFNETLFPVLAQNCSSCHDSLQAPLFAIADDVVSSHDSLIDNALVDFQNASASRLVLKVRANHNCWTPDCDDDAEELETKINAWKQMNEQGGGGGGGDTTKPKSAEILIPESIPTALPATPYYLSLSLGGISGMPSDATLEVAIYELNGSAYVFGPVGIRSSVQLYVKKVDLQLNRVSATPTFHTINVLTQINMGAAPGFVLSPAQPVVPAPNGRGVDQLRFVFDEIRPATQEEINNFAQTQRFNEMMAQLDQGTCGSCHFSEIIIDRADGRPTGYNVPAFQGFTTPSQFKNIQQGNFADGTPRYFVLPGNATLSSLYRSVAHLVGANNFPDIQRAMPPNSGANQRTPIMNAIQPWIANEAP